MHYLEKNEIDVAVIQETKLTSKSKLKDTPNYTLVRKDRGKNKGGGVATLVHSSIPFKVIDSPNPLKDDDFIEEVTISLQHKDGPLLIRNTYIPPASSCNQGYAAPVAHLADGLGDTFLLLGDLNGHHHMWNSEDEEDARGRLLADWIEEADLGLLNEDTPTRITATACTSPDLSIASPNCLPACNWTADVSMSSDHLPILIKMETNMNKTKSENKTYINFNKADWAAFYFDTETCFANAIINDNVHSSEKTFRKIINKAAKKHIPAGRIPHTFNAVPSDTAKLMEERDKVRKENPADPRLPDLNKNININIRDHRQKKWTEHLEKCGPGSKKLWSTIKSLTTNNKKQPQNQSIKFKGTHHNNPRKIANMFNRQFTPNATTIPTKEARNIRRSLRKKSDEPEIIITEIQVRQAIKKSKSSKAMGPDNISPIMLKHLGSHGIRYLTNLLNCCINKSIIPPVWKTARIIPLLKPGKPQDEGPSYRPISLLSPAAKLLEGLVLAPLQESANLAEHQHGFRKGRSTTTALHDIVSHIKAGLNREKPVKRTVMVAVDLSRAFDTVDHDILLTDIAKINLNTKIKRFMVAYLRGRQSYVEFRGSTSRYRKLRQGVPQGGVLSPTLFNIYMCEVPTPSGPDEKLTTYADDGSALGSGAKILPICHSLNQYLDTLNQWYKNRNLTISAPKSSATIFSTWSNEIGMELPIFIDGTRVPTTKEPKILGVTLDPTLSFKYHVKNTRDKLNKKNNVLKALAGSSWGKEKEVLTTTYKAIGRSLLTYGAPIWTPGLSQTHWQTLQAGQNAALRIATGSVLMSSIDHLHAETNQLPVKEHNHMISKQFLLATKKPDHQNHNQPPQPQRYRCMKGTLDSEFNDEISIYLNNGSINTQEYKAALKDIHTQHVRQYIRSREPSKVLDAPTPAVSLLERNLDRRARTTLSQLRAGYSPYLNSYMHRLQPTIHHDSCPKCGQSPHSTAHLFECPADPTDLTAWSLWDNPPAAALFLGLCRNLDPDDEAETSD